MASLSAGWGFRERFSLVAPELAPQAEGHAGLDYKICMGEDETFEETRLWAWLSVD